MAKAKAAAPKTATVEIEMQPSPDAGEAVSLERQALALVVRDRETHAEALEFVRGCKQLRRKIEDHWKRITSSVDDLKRNLLKMKNSDLEPVDRAIEILTERATSYDRERQRLEREEQDRLRHEAEQKAEDDRRRELAEREAAALKAEESSPTLSAREQQFVELYLQRPIDAVRHANTVGYKDYRAAAERLLASPKIQDAIQAKRTAMEIRRQAEARRQEPLTVQTTKVVTERAKVSGVRSTTYYSAQVVNLDQLIDAVLAGTVSRTALKADEVWLNAQARQVQDEATFNAAFPGVVLKKRDGLAG